MLGSPTEMYLRDPDIFRRNLLFMEDSFAFFKLNTFTVVTAVEIMNRAQFSFGDIVDQYFSSLLVTS